MLGLLSSTWMAVLLLLFANQCPISSAANTYPPCTSNQYGSDGRIDVGAMLYACSGNISGVLLPPSYYPDDNDTPMPVSVGVQLAINNLISVEDLSSEFTMNFFLRVVWTDARWNMPEMWSELSEEATKEGIEISKYIDNQDQLNMWTPDMYFYESTETEVINTLIKIKPNGTLFWSRQMIATFSNPQMPFRNFPKDTQNFSITIESFSYDNKLLTLYFINNKAVVLLDSLRTGKSIISTNQLWTYQSYAAEIKATEVPSPVNPDRTYSTMYLNMAFERQSLGIIYRLALPILIFVVIVGVAFWSDENNRIEVTLQMILVVSALYIMIGQSIPLVGYLTTIDLFIITVFFVLGAILSIHFISVILAEKSDKYPMDAFYREFIVTFFRAMWLPSSLGIFIYFFDVVHLTFLVALILFSVFCFLYTTGQVRVLLQTLQYSVFKLKCKKELVKAGALDEKTERPLTITVLETLTLQLIEVYLGKIPMITLFNTFKPDVVDRAIEKQKTKHLPHTMSSLNQRSSTMSPSMFASMNMNSTSTYQIDTHDLDLQDFPGTSPVMDHIVVGNGSSKKLSSYLKVPETIDEENGENQSLSSTSADVNNNNTTSMDMPDESSSIKSNPAYSMKKYSNQNLNSPSMDENEKSAKFRNREYRPSFHHSPYSYSVPPGIDRQQALLLFKKTTASKMGVFFRNPDQEELYLNQSAASLHPNHNINSPKK